jgi:hypothetical protein
MLPYRNTCLLLSATRKLSPVVKAILYSAPITDNKNEVPNSMEQSASWEPNRSSANQELSRIL